VVRLLTFCFVFLKAAAAMAGVRVEIPDGWQEGPRADQASRDQASRWASASQMELAQVGSSSDKDHYIESVVVLSLNERLTQNELSHDIAALKRVRALISPAFPLIDGPPASQQFIQVNDGEGFLAHWKLEGIEHDFLLVAAGDRLSLVIISVAAPDAILYQALVDKLLHSTSGVRAPIDRFVRWPWRWGALGLWLALAALLHGLSLRFTDRTGDHRAAARQAMPRLLALATIGGFFGYAVLSEVSLSVEASELTVVWVASEITASGALIAALWSGGVYRVTRVSRTRGPAVAPVHETFRRMKERGAASSVVDGDAAKLPVETQAANLEAVSEPPEG